MWILELKKMTEKQITPMGLTTAGWNRVDDLLAKANKEQIRTILMKCAEKLPDDLITIQPGVKR